MLFLQMKPLLYDFLWGRGEEVRTTLWINDLSFQFVFIREAVVEIKSGKKRFMV